MGHCLLNLIGRLSWSAVPPPPVNLNWRKVMWRNCLDEYLAAKRAHHEACRLCWESYQAMERLDPPRRTGQMTRRRRSPADWVYEASGMALADERRERAAARERRAKHELGHALRAAIPKMSAVTKLMVQGRLLCSDLPRAANR